MAILNTLLIYLLFFPWVVPKFDVIDLQHNTVVWHSVAQPNPDYKIPDGTALHFTNKIGFSLLPLARLLAIAVFSPGRSPEINVSCPRSGRRTIKVPPSEKRRG